MFQYLIVIKPLGFMYGSAGAFLSPENLVGRSGSKFPPEAATLAGLFFSSNKVKSFAAQKELRDNLFVTGPFWAKSTCLKSLYSFYVPIPWHMMISQKEKKTDEWEIVNHKWQRKSRRQDPESEEDELEPDRHWQNIKAWGKSAKIVRQNAEKVPWEYVPMLHPRLEDNERHVLRQGEEDEEQGSLFLENAVQMREDSCLVYLSTHELKDGWYRFGGESHLVEINCHDLKGNHPIVNLLRQPIKRACALITPGVWGSNDLSYRYPKHPYFSNQKRPMMLTKRPIYYRYRLGYGEKDQEKIPVGIGKKSVLDV